MQKLDVKQMWNCAFGMIMLALPGNAEMEYKYRQYAKQAKHQILSSPGLQTQFLIIYPVSLLDYSQMSALYSMSGNTLALTAEGMG